jgi:hypothetical protein
MTGCIDVLLPTVIVNPRDNAAGRDAKRDVEDGGVSDTRAAGQDQQKTLVSSPQQDAAEAYKSCKHQVSNLFGGPHPTWSYEIGHYDRQNYVAAVSSQSNIHVWEQFARNYVEPHKPVKIYSYLNFNDKAPPAGAWSACNNHPHERNESRDMKDNNTDNGSDCHSKLGSTLGTGTHGTNGTSLVQKITKRFPAEAMEAVVTVQCSDSLSMREKWHDEGPETKNDDNQSNSNQHQKKRKRDGEHDLFLDPHEALTVSACSALASNCNSRDKATSERPALFMGQEEQITLDVPLRDILLPNEESSLLRKQHYVDRQLRFYVAQATIASKSEDESSTRLEAQPNGSPHIVVPDDCLVEGTKLQDSPALHSLLPGVVVPSQLLPPDKVSIQNINFWYTNEAAITNTHYDSHHNLLLVLCGTKTVELMPPDAIQPSAFYSTHANHPAILQPNVRFLEGTERNRVLRETKDAVVRNTMVASVSAGEALYIPAGWWHRVESSSQCMALNVWFDVIPSTCSPYYSSSLGHMKSFYAREWTREAYEAAFDDYLLPLMQAGRVDQALNVQTRLLEQAHLPWSSEIAPLLRDPLSCVEQICQQMAKLLSGAAHYDKAEGSTDRSILLLASALLGLLLCHIQCDNRQHRAHLSQVFFHTRMAIAIPVMVTNLSPTASYHLTQCFEKEMEDAEDLPLSSSSRLYNAFVEACGDQVDVIMAHLTTSVDIVKEAVAKQFCSNTLFGETKIQHCSLGQTSS